MKSRWIARTVLAVVMAVGAASHAIADNGGGCLANPQFCNGAGTIPEPGVLEVLGMGVAGAIAVRLITRRRK
jgi:hypothetical protein